MPMQRFSASGERQKQDEAAVLTPAFRQSRLPGFVLSLGDWLILQGSVIIGWTLRAAVAHWYPIELPYSVYAGVHVAVCLPVLICAVVGLYPGYGLTPVERLRRRTLAVGLCFALMILFDYLTQDARWSRGLLLATATTALLLLPVWDALARASLVRSGRWGMPVAVFGPAEKRNGIIADLQGDRLLGWIPVRSGESPFEPADPPALAAPAVKLAILIVPADFVSLHTITDSLSYPRIVLLPDFGPIQTQWVQPREIGTRLGLELRRSLLEPANRWAKRTLDILFSLIALVFALPLIAACAVLIRVASPGPAFYVQDREGLNGRNFGLIKIRTMVADAETRLEGLLDQHPETGREWREFMKLREDPRILPGVGCFLRRWSLDELPQLWNVLKGDMSLIGPRPLPRYHLESLAPDVYRLRRQIRPGITGLWQISGRNYLSIERQQQLDTYYIRNWSLWLDLHILARTVVVVAKGQGAC
ncbi:MAG: exopolysaccharide biosynthesis polyprenyl glycosylphosphotransferase [Alphaproteobacteria bacterium]